MIIKYQLEHRTTPTGVGLTAPECINDGGHFLGTDGTLIGYSDGTLDLCLTCVELTAAELEARQVAMHRLKPMMKEGAASEDVMVEMTEAEERAIIQEWVTTVS